MSKQPAQVKELFDSGVPRSESDLLAKIYGDAAARIRQTVLSPIGNTQSGREFRQARAAQLMAQIDGIQKDLGKKAGLWVGRNMPQAYVQGKRRGDQQAKEAGIAPKAGSPLAGSFSLIDRRAVSVLAQDTLADLHRAASSMADRGKSAVKGSIQDELATSAESVKKLLRETKQGKVSEAAINMILAQGVIEGVPRQTIKRLTEELRQVHGETVEITDKNGDTINFDVKHYAEMVARTKTRMATVVARHSRLQEVGIDLVVIIGRVSKNFCTAFLGQAFSLSGKSDKYPAYASLPGGGPPFHPFCSKSTRPFVEELASKTQGNHADGLDDAKELLGMDTASAQRAFKDLQLHQQQRDRYATTEKRLFA